jgi:predicted S18 family serine protease
MSSSSKYLFSSSSEAQQAVSNLEVMKKYYNSKCSYFKQKAQNSSIEIYGRYLDIANDFDQKSRYCHNWIIKAKIQVDLLRIVGY